MGVAPAGPLVAMRRVPGLIGLAPSELLVVFNPETPDRTAAIEGRGPSPLPWLRESAEWLQRLGATHVAYPCNTAHYFLKRATPQEWPLCIPLVDMIDETVTAVVEAGHRRVGLLATTGTVKARLYQDALVARGVEVVLPDAPARARGPVDEVVGPDRRVRAELYARCGAHSGAELDAPAFESLASLLVATLGEQEGLVMETIVGVRGVKAGYSSGLVAQLAREAARRLAERGAGALVLGCTELPLVLRGAAVELDGRHVPLVDPTRVLADRLRRIEGRPGVAGGLGPEATIDLVEKLGAPADFTRLQRDVFRATIEVLGAARDQDHLKLFAVAGPDPAELAGRLARAGAGLLVLSEQAAPWRSRAEAASGVPVVAAHEGVRVGPDVVRWAAADEVAARASRVGA